MQVALDLAKNGEGNVLPNPVVGCVIVKENQKIGQGYHQKFGADHAEINALREAGPKAENSTMYVTLEPCAHYGKTPPCTAAIIKSGIKKVFVAMEDPNPKVAGKGIAALAAAGIEVKTGLLNYEAHKMNRAFIKYISTGLPYVSVKIAQTLDGKIADTNNNSQWITGTFSRQSVQNLRFTAGAVLVGAGTVCSDDPKLTIRNRKVMQQPWRIVLDPALQTSVDSQLYTDENKQRTIVFTSVCRKNDDAISKLEKNGVHLYFCDCEPNLHFELNEVLKNLGEMEIAHVLVEGGSRIFSSFMQQKCADELLLFIAPKLFGKGLSALDIEGYSASAPLRFRDQTWSQSADDMLFRATIDWD